jgi:hypothetical protein
MLPALTNISSGVPSSLASTKFIEGLPMKPATNMFTG